MFDKKLISSISLLLLILSGLWFGGCGQKLNEEVTQSQNPTGLLVVSTTPTSETTNEAVDIHITATFNESINSSTLNSSTFTLSSSLGAVTGSISYDAGTNTAIFIPYGLLANSKSFTARISTRVKSSSGRIMSSDYTWSFSTRPASASVLYNINGAAGDNFGVAVSDAGDIDLGGRYDFMIGAPNASPGGKINAGSVYIYSGAGGTLLYQKDGEAAGDKFGASVSSADDVNGDGRADYIIGAWSADPGGSADAGSVYVYSGGDQSQLYKKNGSSAGEHFGYSVSNAGDINADGQYDFMIGIPSANPGGKAEAGSACIYSGANGSLIYQKDGAAAVDLFGTSVSYAGDVNGDGKPDFIVGAYRADPSLRTDAGSAYVYSGADGSLLYQKDGAAASNYFGWAVSSAGDVNGDGRGDFIISAPIASPGGKTNAGSVYVYSGADGSLIYQKDGEGAGDNFGYSVSVAGDVDGDYKADFIIGAPMATPNGKANAGSVYVYSGADGSLLYQIDGKSAGKLFGISVSNAGDVNGDFRTEFIAGELGSAYVYMSR